MPRPIGKVRLPLAWSTCRTLYSAEERPICTQLIDSRNARGFLRTSQRRNRRRGPLDKIVKGYEYDQGNYVMLSDKSWSRRVELSAP